MTPSHYREKQIYINVFPRVVLSNNIMYEGEIYKEMNKEIVENEIKTINKGYLLNLDLDHFDLINKTYGMKIGDLVLTEVTMSL